MLRAKDIMSKEVISVTPDTTVEDLGRLLIEKGISGVPVIDSEQKLFGIVTENDLIKKNVRLHIPTVLRLFDAFIPLESDVSVEKQIRIMSASKVSEICARQVVTVGPESTLQDISTIMYERGIHLIPVMESGKVVGIVGKIDIIKGTFIEPDK